MDGFDQNLKPGFALSLSFDGISLLHRAAGGWRLVGETPLDVDDLPDALGKLRAKAEQLEPGQLACKLIIPNDQIRYMSVTTGDVDRGARELLAIKDLEGATPYQVEELVFDLSQDGEVTHVAAVARETLAEAESFAAEHGFNPTSFVAIPGDNAYLGEPHFGSAAAMDGITVTPDGVAVVIIGPAIFPEPDPEPELPVAETPVTEPVLAPAPEEPAPPAVGFSSRRRKPEDTPKPAPKTAVAPELTPQVNSPAEASADTPPVAEATAPVVPTIDPAPAAAPKVAAPKLDIPEAPQAAALLQSGADDSAFHSRRNAVIDTVTPTETPKPTPVTAPPPENAEQDEAVRMTLFGARDQVKVGGKPKYLGLILTAALVLFMVAAALLAALSTDGPLTGWFRKDPAPEASNVEQTPQTAEDPKPEPPLAETPVEEEPERSLETPPISSQPAPVQAPPQAPTDAPVLSDTDIAVLDALRDFPDEPQEDAPEAVENDEGFATENAPLDALTPNTNAAARYAATGIWPTAPIQSDTPAVIGLNDLYDASIDRTDLSRDAVAMPSAESFRTDIALIAPSTPAAPGTKFDLNDQGLVTPTPQGAETPDGVLVYLGRPPVTPPPTPTRFETQPETDALRARLAGLRPKLRPEDLSEQAERNQLGGLSRTELAEVRPRLRPESVQERALAAQQAATSAAESETPVTATLTQQGDISTATARAIAQGPKPRLRPSNMGSIVKQAERRPATQVATIAPATVTPSIPSSASVARQATFENSLNLRQLNLIGVYGTPSDRRALIRMPSGRYKKVKVGDKIDGGKVLAIGDSSLRYEKRGRNLTLNIPDG